MPEVEKELSAIALYLELVAEDWKRWGFGVPAKAITAAREGIARGDHRKVCA